MSDRLSDERLAEIRDAVASDSDQWDAVPSCDLLSLLDEVLEARRKIPILEGRAVEYLSAEDEKGRRIAELEAEIGLSDKRLWEQGQKMDAREAQLAEMRREMMEDEEAGGAYYTSIKPILDRHAIPTTPPEAEGVPPEPKTRRPIDVTLSPREASPPPPAVDPREEDDA